jgi:HEAT repeat protein
MSPKKTVLIFLLAVLLASMSIKSTVIRTLDVASLISQADIIVIGQIISVTDRGPTTLDLGGGSIPATDFEAVLQVDQLLKGSPHAQNLFVDFLVPQMPIGIQSVVSGQYGLFFLAALQNQLRFTDPMHPSLPAVRNMKLPPGAVLDQVTVALGQVLVAPQVPDADLFWALDALGRLKTDLARDTLRQALKSSSGNIHLDVARTLVARNDVAGLEPVEAALLHPTGLSSNMISNLAGSLGGLRDPQAIPSLSKLIASSNAETRLGAAIALRQSQSAAALIPLSRLLEDTDTRTRYYAVVGMGEITRQDEWTPAFDEFHKYEAKYLSYWRDWAASNLPRGNTRK